MTMFSNAVRADSRTGGANLPPIEGRCRRRYDECEQDAGSCERDARFDESDTSQRHQIGDSCRKQSLLKREIAVSLRTSEGPFVPQEDTKMRKSLLWLGVMGLWSVHAEHGRR